MTGIPPDAGEPVPRRLTPEEIARLRNALVAYARFRLPTQQDAEDVAHEAFTIGFASLGTVRELPRFLFGVARHLVSSFHLRRNRAAKPEWLAALHAIFGESAGSPEETFEDEALLSRLELALTELPPRQEAVMRLRKLEDLSVKQTATAIGISTHSVEKDQRKALADLTRTLRAWHLDPASVPKPRLSRPSSASQPEPAPKTEDGSGPRQSGTP